jgi:hypothetical protein
MERGGRAFGDRLGFKGEESETAIKMQLRLVFLQFYCVFPIISGVFMFFLAGIQIYRLTKLYHKEEESSFLGLFLDAFLSLISCTMVREIRIR